MQAVHECWELSRGRHSRENMIRESTEHHNAGSIPFDTELAKEGGKEGRERWRCATSPCKAESQKASLPSSPKEPREKLRLSTKRNLSRSVLPVTFSDTLEDESPILLIICQLTSSAPYQTGCVGEGER